MGNVDTAPLVGLIGPAGAGKDTIAGHLVEHHGFHRLAFADRLAKFVERIDPVFAALVAAHGGYEPAKRAAPYIRQRLGEVGNSAREIIDSHVWIDVVEDQFSELCVNTPVVISDVRFRTEAQWIEDNGGALVEVTRPGHEALSAEARGVAASTDLVIANDGDLHMLRERTDMVAEDFLL